MFVRSGVRSFVRVCKCLIDYCYVDISICCGAGLSVCCVVVLLFCCVDVVLCCGVWLLCCVVDAFFVVCCLWCVSCWFVIL